MWLRREDAGKVPRRASTIVGVAVGLVLTATGVQPARAGTYEMWNCNVPGRAISLLDPWQPTDWLLPDVSMVDACATGGGWGVYLRGGRQVGDGYGAAIFLMRPTGPRSEIRFVKVTVWYTARLGGSGQPMYFDVGDLRPDGLHRALISGPPGSENAVAEQVITPDAAQIQLAIRCGFTEVESTESCVAAHDVPLLIHGIKVTLTEDVPPIVLRLGGTLLEDGQQTGIRTVTYSASDPQSGISTIEVLLDETVVASSNLTPRCSYSDFTVCPASVDDTLPVDTHAVANGSHRLSLRVRDAAGNERLVHSEGTIAVANAHGPEAIPTYAVSVHFKGESGSTLTVPYGRRVVLRGRVRQSSAPIAAGSAIEVLESPDSKGKRERATARVETEADGSFSAVLSTHGPSRLVRLAYLPTGGGSVLSQPLKLRVRSASRLRASLHGRMVHFSGLVLSGPIAARGKGVLMEGRSPGSSWTRFMSLRTDRRGRFSGTYRLRVRRPGVVLKIRAVVPSENGYGYVTSRSRAVALRVR